MCLVPANLICIHGTPKSPSRPQVPLVYINKFAVLIDDISNFFSNFSNFSKYSRQLKH